VMHGTGQQKRGMTQVSSTFPLKRLSDMLTSGLNSHIDERGVVCDLKAQQSREPAGVALSTTTKDTNRPPSGWAGRLSPPLNHHLLCKGMCAHL
jgi:hypothetical protein